ncbi:MAG: bifunctional demethylmenaquinone methyltransferase/2-methoxy-6-polyprenyl-1,4-benzoquinol methylase UbiE [Muribaculaceae bacterium]|nr:bifunctional demethylmenaquinone methyltransferase/2-methoxy-6-polyprenyl-1,4-benzoquinol methylase UbiE [Muribaculaceae bacterium]
MPEVEHINPYHDDSRSKGEQVQQMFDNIAPAYDFMNRAMTFGLDRAWLKALLREAAKGEPVDVLDLATGTGDVALALRRRLPGANICGIDLSEGMLEIARRKNESANAGITFIQGDCLATGLPDSSADLITIAYGVRNFQDLQAGYREMARVLRPGGKLCVLELAQPANPVLKAGYRAYTSTLIPLAGRLMSKDSRAYSYLPESVAAVPQRAAMTELMEQAGLAEARFKALIPGVCVLYTATKL